MIEDGRDGNALTRELRKWRENFDEEGKMEVVETVEEEFGQISKDEVREAVRQLVLMTYRCGRWKSRGETPVEVQKKQIQHDGEKMPEKWRKDV